MSSFTSNDSILLFCIFMPLFANCQHSRWLHHLSRPVFVFALCPPVTCLSLSLHSVTARCTSLYRFSYHVIGWPISISSFALSWSSFQQCSIFVSCMYSWKNKNWNWNWNCDFWNLWTTIVIFKCFLIRVLGDRDT